MNYFCKLLLVMATPCVPWGCKQGRRVWRNTSNLAHWMHLGESFSPPLQCLALNHFMWKKEPCSHFIYIPKLIIWGNWEQLQHFSPSQLKDYWFWELKPCSEAGHQWVGYCSSSWVSSGTVGLEISSGTKAGVICPWLYLSFPEEICCFVEIYAEEIALWNGSRTWTLVVLFPLVQKPNKRGYIFKNSSWLPEWWICYLCPVYVIPLWSHSGFLKLIFLEGLDCSSFLWFQMNFAEIQRFMDSNVDAFQHWISLLKYFLYLSSLETLSFHNSFSDWLPNHIFIHLGVIQWPTKITVVSLPQRRAQLCKGNRHSWSSRSCVPTAAQCEVLLRTQNFDFLWYRSSLCESLTQSNPHCTVFP